MAEEILCQRLSNGVLLPVVSFGTWCLKPDNPATTQAIKAALQAGYRGIDTAWIYGNEQLIGSLVQSFDIGARIAPLYTEHKLKLPLSSGKGASAVVVDSAAFKKSFELPHQASPKDNREIFVTSKIWIAHYTPEGIENQVEEHLRDFGRDSCDLMLLHWPGFHVEHGARPTTEAEMRSDQFPIRKTCWLKMEELYHAKKIRAIGVSNYLVKHLSQLCEWITERREGGDKTAVYPMVDQIELSVFLQPSAELQALCNKHQILITSYSTLGSADAVRENLEHAGLKEIASHYTVAGSEPVSNAAVMLRWAIEEGYTILPRSTSPSRVVDNLLSSLYQFQLSEADLATLRGMNMNKRSLPNPDDVG